MSHKRSLFAENSGKHLATVHGVTHGIEHGIHEMLCPVSGTEITQRRDGGDWEPVAFVLDL